MLHPVVISVKRKGTEKLGWYYVIRVIFTYLLQYYTHKD
jgi:hypothetical protein